MWWRCYGRSLCFLTMGASRNRVSPMDGGPKALAIDMLRLFNAAGHKGGEGVLLLNVAPRGYWRETLFATAGRPLPPPIVTIFYAVYVVLVTYIDKHHLKDYDLEVDKYMLVSVGSALGFLLVFRSNAAYERWWDGRKKWGMVINRTRDLARQSIGYIKDGDQVDSMIRYIIAFAVTMKRHLRAERDLPELLKCGVLTQEQVDEVKLAKHMPLKVLEKLTETIEAARCGGLLTDIQAMALDANLTDFEDQLGGCERILKTKMPFGYIVHLRAFLIVWLLALPFGLLKLLGWVTIPVAILVFFALVGIEMIGVEIENPFGHDFNDLPLDSITEDTIGTNLLELLERHTKHTASPQAATDGKQ